MQLRSGPTFSSFGLYQNQFNHFCDNQKKTFFSGIFPIVAGTVSDTLAKKMSIGGYKIRNKEEVHFLSFAVVEWVDVFTRQEYRDILLKSVRHCQEHRGLLVHAWCLMSNHAHWMLSAVNNDLSDILRDFKKYSSKQIIKAINENKHESRRDWMLKIFQEHGQKNSRNSEFQFWRQDNQPKECFGNAFTVQKIHYIHNNPVVAGIVEQPEHYLYSSARDYHLGKRVGLLHVDFL